MLTIAFVYYKGSLGGAPRVMMEIAAHMARQPETEIHAILGSSGPAVEAYRSFCQTHLFHLPYRLNRMSGKWRGGLFQRWLARKTRSIQPDLIYHTNGGDAFWMDWARATGLPVIAHIHGLHTRHFFQPDDYLNLFSTYADCYVCCTEESRRRLTLGMGVPADKSQTIYNGIPTSRQKEMNVQQAGLAFRRKLGLPENAFVVGGCGQVSYGKGTDLFVRTLELLQGIIQERPVVGLWLGRPLEKTHFGRSLAQYIQRAGLKDTLRFPGYQQDIYPALAAVDVFCCSSREEGLPLVVMEAMSLGKPVVSVPVGGVPELLEDKYGRLVPNHAPYALARAIAALANDPQAAAETGRAGQVHIFQNFNSEDRMKDFEDLIRQTIDRKGR